MVYDKNKIYIAITIVSIIIVGLIYTLVRNDKTSYLVNTEQNITLNTPPVDTNEELEVYNELPIETYRVFISGEVINPDVYDIDSDARIIDLLEMAGGATEDADLNQINLADFLSDAQHIIIPKIGSDEAINNVAVNNNGSQGSDNNLVNINTGSLNELMSLPGIGTVTAQNIIDYRELNGNFGSIEDIKQVNRIGNSTFENIKNLITV